MSFQMKEEKREGKFLFLEENKPVAMNLVEDLGKVQAVGKFALNDKGDQQYWEAFKVQVFDGVEAKEKTLVGGWRLRKALGDALKGNPNPEPRVTITMKYVMERLKNGPKAVKHYDVVVEETPEF